ncbi:MAG: DUF2182 domain-containing protein [Solimonas sp.]
MAALMPVLPMGRVAHCARRGGASGMVFVGAPALLFAASVALTVVGHDAMPSLPALPMCRGGSVAAMLPVSIWLPMPGHGWAATFAAFMAMWMPMMAAMMLPSLLPVLWRYRAALGGGAHADAQAMQAGLAYFLVWMVCGMAIFAGGAALAPATARLLALAGFMPMAAGAAVLLAGLWQFTPWKARHLAGCCAAPACGHQHAWAYGLHLGLHCNIACAGYTAALLSLGLMDLRVMAVVTAAITLERLASQGARIARLTGLSLVIAGLLMLARTAGLIAVS